MVSFLAGPLKASAHGTAHRGIEVMNMIRKGQMKDTTVTRTAAAQFYSLLA
jgi:hypothetical protein